MRRVRSFDSILFFTTTALVIGGFLIFMSASLGLLARDGAQFSDLATSQLFLGVIGGFVALVVSSSIPVKFFRTYAFHLFAASLLLTALVFMPVIGLELNGARSWLNFGVTTFQPAEALKIGYVLYLATWLSRRNKKSATLVERVAPFVILTALVGALLLLQPDTGTFAVIAASGAAMFFASGAKWKDIALLALCGTLFIGAFISFHPHALERITTFVNPAKDPLGAGYQVQKSLIAVGSGEVLGRGFGQSIQKFTTLPEPTSDSIFAVFAEEFGFLGAAILILGFLIFALRGLWIAARSADAFSGLVALGIVILIVVQSFFNIGSMLAVFPLTGLPLIFVSHGGSALFMALASVGILLSISRTART